MKIRRSIIAMLLCIVLVLSACSSKTGEKEQKEEPVKTTEDEADKEEKDEEKVYQAKLDAITPSAYNNVDGIKLEKGAYISVIGKSADGEFWKAVKEGAEQAGKDINENLGYEGNDKVKITYSGPSESENVDEQVNILDEELARYPAAVAISIADTQACGVQFDLASENNIPVVAFDSGSDYKGLMAMVSTDNRAAAKEAAQHMSELLGEGGKVIILAHDSKSKTARIREKVFAKAIKKEYKNLSVDGVYRLDEMKKVVADEVNAGVYSLDGKETSGEKLSEEEKITEESITKENIIDYILKKNPDVKGCYTTNGETATAFVKGLERAAIDGVTVLGYDLGEEEKKAMEEGKIAGMALQNPFGMGYASVVAAARAALEMGNEAEIDTGYVWVTKDNLESEEIQKMLYNDL